MIEVTGRFYDDKKLALDAGIELPTACSKPVLYQAIADYNNALEVAAIPVLSRPVKRTVKPMGGLDVAIARPSRCITVTLSIQRPVKNGITV
jgi:hypothetical protein